MLGGPSPVEVGQVRLLRDSQERGAGVRDDVVARQAFAPVGEQSDLVGQWHRRRVDLEGARPCHLAVGGLGCKFDAASAGAARHARHLLGPGDEGARLLRSHVDGGGEPDGAIDDHAHAHAELGVIRRRLGVRVVQADRLVPDALDPELRRLAARGGAEGGVRQCREVVRVEWHQRGTVG